MPRITPFLLLLLAAAPLHAQSGPSTGSRVRAFAPGILDSRLVGTVQSATLDSLVVTRADRTTVRLEKVRIDRLQVSRGRNRLAWAAIGAGGGMLAGGFLGAASGGRDDVTGLGAAAGMVSGMAAGLLVGAVVGAVVAPERWTEYPLPRGQD